MGDSIGNPHNESRFIIFVTPDNLPTVFRQLPTFEVYAKDVRNEFEVQGLYKTVGLCGDQASHLGSRELNSQAVAGNRHFDAEVYRVKQLRFI